MIIFNVLRCESRLVIDLYMFGGFVILFFEVDEFLDICVVILNWIVGVVSDIFIVVEVVI